MTTEAKEIMNHLRAQIARAYDRLTTVYHADPDQNRRGRLLSILLLGTGLAGVLGLIAVGIFFATSGFSAEGVGLLVSGAALLAMVAGLFFLNRHKSPRLAAGLFLFGLLIILSFSDSPQQLVSGRTTLTFVLPIIMASVILAPASSFAVATLVSFTLFGISSYYAVPVVLSTPTVLAFFLIALVGWLAARNLEDALRNLQLINQELDQRVADRTRELRDALLREQAETSKNLAILSSIADGVIVFDTGGRAIVANPAMTNVIDQPASKVLNRNMPELMERNVPPPMQETVMGLMQDSTAPENTLNVDWGSKTLSLSVAPLRSDAGEITGTVAVFRDVTREAELSRMKSAFVSMVSHELRTPLNAIQGYSEILQQNVYGSLNEKQLGVIGRILSNTTRLLDIVSDLLDQAHIEAGTLPINNAALAPAELIDGVQSVVSNMAQAKGLQIDTRIDTNFPPEIVGDAQRLNQVLVNLITNAIKYTERGKVSIRLYRPDLVHWAFEVSDTGAGIPVSAQAYIFEPFRQMDNSISRRHGGVGLGLSIVKKLVSLMNGDVTLHSEPGQGSTFTVVLPLLTPE